MSQFFNKPPHINIGGWDAGRPSNQLLISREAAKYIDAIGAHCNGQQLFNFFRNMRRVYMGAVFAVFAQFINAKIYLSATQRHVSGVEGQLMTSPNS